MSVSITINYTPGTNSDSASPAICHRICYRRSDLSPSANYCCLIDYTASTAGVPKTFVITVHAAPCSSVPDVALQDCETSVYEGYVQACCEDINSVSGRVSWIATFQPNPDCVNKLVCCQNQLELIGFYITIVNAGTGYTASTFAISVIRDPSDPVPAGGANDASLTATVNGTFTVVSINVISGGLYGINPTIVIPSSPAPGIQATAVIKMPCTLPPANPGDVASKGNCTESPMGIETIKLLLGQCADMCFPKEFPFIYPSTVLSGLPDTAHYSYGTEGCCDCTTCRDYKVITSSGLSSIHLVYTECNNSLHDSQQVTISVAGSGSHNIDCAVPGSIYCIDDPHAIVSISDNGGCSGCSP